MPTKNVLNNDMSEDELLALLHANDSEEPTCDNAEDENAVEDGFFADYAAFEAYLENKGMFHMELGLERIQRVLQELELNKPEYAIVQVLGTNGKGSTSSFLQSLGTSAGLNVGLYTSPHFVSVRERVRINGSMLEEDEWLNMANDIYDAGGDSLTYFEYITVLAALAFDVYEVDFAVMEAGLGGAHDATTALPADLMLYAPIGIDHENVLGKGIAAIATDKAGAVRSAAPVMSANQCPEALTILQKACAAQNVELLLAENCATLPASSVAPNALGLFGTHQRGNALLALAGLEKLMEIKNFERPALIEWEDVLTLGLADAWIAGRLQSLAPYKDADGADGKGVNYPALLLDGGHNAHGVTALAKSLRDAGIRPAALIYASMKDKDLTGVPEILASITDGAVFLPVIPNNERAATPQELADALAPTLGRERLHPCGTMEELFARTLPEVCPEIFNGTKTAPVLCCGSLFLLAEFFRLRPQCLEAASRNRDA